ncbi:ABC transporter permease [Pseudogemmobacter humi]|uniref:Spermidine/putrescine transport system permease protein PotB n=1 Tax=Pseudogemmobacter humi TaxID=2483812 RepID=A0A3P5XZI0_9RHOB|nr:ABC transporter permease [Pseudogemmobacter humi]VDC33600.1 Spermidine/putrescine transport system permease protein PotB [Pseudogemmobacter humi]
MASGFLRRHSASLMLAPAMLLLAVFFLWPVLDLVRGSFAHPDGSLGQYERVFSRPAYVLVLQRTFLISGLTVLICAVIAYPVAYRLATASTTGKLVILAVILIPFWTNLLVLCYGWLIILSPTGTLNKALTGIGLIDNPLPLSGNMAGVLIGMVQTMLPYMVLPVAANMARIDPRIPQAARSLGAPPLQVFLRTWLPLTMSGVIAGGLLVFIMSIGFFIIPAILGGTKDIFIAQLIEMNINKVLNWGFAAALSTVVLVTTLVLYGVGVRWFGVDALWGRQ